MTISLKISQRTGTGWSSIDLSAFEDGNHLCEFLEDNQGRECVAEWVNGDKRAMACGTDKQSDAYRGKGHKTITLTSLAAGLRSKGYHNELMRDVKHPLIEKAKEVFGSPVSQISLEDAAMNREERVAIMTEAGDVSEEEAQAYCDTKPEEYGERQSIMQ